MDEMSKTCGYCGAEVGADVDVCPQCGKKIGEADTLKDEATAADVESMAAGEESIDIEGYEPSGTDSMEQVSTQSRGRGPKAGIIVAIAAGALIVVIAAAYLLMDAVLPGLLGGGRQLSGPWSGTVVFTKVTSPNSEAEKQMQGNLNQPNALEVQLYMDNNRTGAAAVPGLTPAGGTVPVTYSGGKLKFTIEQNGNKITIEGTAKKDKATGDFKMNGPFIWHAKMDNGTGQQVEANFSGSMDLTMKKR